MPITPSIHLGKEIESRINQLNITASEFARRINTSKQNVSRILKKESMDTATLQVYCEVLNFNFFELFCPKASTSIHTEGDMSPATSSGNIDLRQVNSGRDYAENGGIHHHGNEYNGTCAEFNSDLEKENAELKQKLIEAQDKIIKLMEGK